MSQHQIVVNQTLIELLGDKLYTNRLDVILTRELLQNAVDASPKDSPIYINYRWEEPYFYIEVSDQGCGMTAEVLTTVFLSIGSSYKPMQAGEEATGGFGIAKVAIFNCAQWSVWTNDSFIDQTLELQEANYRKGTVVTCVAKVGDTWGSDKQQVWDIIATCGVENPIIVNGNPVEPYKPRTRITRHETAHGIPFTMRTATEFAGANNEACIGYLVVRINGLTQYTGYAGVELYKLERNIIIDFGKIGYKVTDKGYPFTLSREQVVPEVRGVYNDWLRELAKDVRSKMDAEERNREVWWENPATGLVSLSYNSRQFRPNLLERRVARLWGKLLEVMYPNENFRIGVTDYWKFGACYTQYEGSEAFIINPNNFLTSVAEAVAEQDSLAVVMGMWHLACHEATHRTHKFHDEDFTSTENDIANRTCTLVTRKENIDKLRVLARKLWK